MPMSFPVSFLLGRELSRSVGVVDSADQTASGIAMAATGGTPVGIVLARQLALNRVPPPRPAFASTTPTSSSSSGIAQTPVAIIGFVTDGLRVQFHDQSTGTVLRRRWRFLDGSGTSTDANPQYVYKASGDYTVELTVYDANDASNTTTCAISVREPAPPPGVEASTAQFAAGFTATVSGRTVKFRDESNGTVVQRLWEFGDGKGKSEKVDDDYTYAADGIYNVTLSIQGEDGTISTVTRKVQVGTPTSAPAPAATSKAKVP